MQQVGSSLKYSQDSHDPVIPDEVEMGLQAVSVYNSLGQQLVRLHAHEDDDAEPRVADMDVEDFACIVCIIHRLATGYYIMHCVAG